MKLRHAQQGMSLIGMMVVAVVAGFFILLGLKLVPTYLEYFSVLSVLESVKNEGASNAIEARQKIQRRFDVNDVNTVTMKDIRINDRGSFIDIKVKYEVRKQLLGNVDLVITFDKQVRVSNR